MRDILNSDYWFSDEIKIRGEIMDEKSKVILETLTDEQKEKANQCKTSAELASYLGGLGMELPDALLDEVSGGIILENGDRMITQKDYDEWLRYVLVPPDLGKNPFNYWITWDIPRICDLPTEGERCVAVFEYCSRKGYEFSLDFTNFW